MTLHLSGPFTRGTTVRVSIVFRNFAGTVADPSTVTFVTEGPGISGEVAYVNGVDSELVKDSTGNYHFDFPLTAEGNYGWRWVGTGAVAVAKEGRIKVAGSQFET